MDVFHGQLPPTSWTPLLCIDRPLNTRLTKDMTTNGGRLFLHCVHANGTLEFTPLWLVGLYGWSKLLHERLFDENIFSFSTL